MNVNREAETPDVEGRKTWQAPWEGLCDVKFSKQLATFTPDCNVRRLGVGESQVAHRCQIEEILNVTM